MPALWGPHSCQEVGMSSHGDIPAVCPLTSGADDGLSEAADTHRCGLCSGYVPVPGWRHPAPPSPSLCCLGVSQPSPTSPQGFAVSGKRLRSWLESGRDDNSPVWACLLARPESSTMVSGTSGEPLGHLCSYFQEEPEGSICLIQEARVALPRAERGGGTLPGTTQQALLPLTP